MARCAIGKVSVGRAAHFFVLVSNDGAERLQVTDTQLHKVRDLIEPSVASMGFRLVQLRMMGGSNRPTLQIMAEPSDGREMNVDDCAEISRTVSAVLDVEDPIAGTYVLEVSSPGIDRPLVDLEDFARYAGFEAKLETRRMLAGQRRFSGQLLGAKNDKIHIAVVGLGGEVKDVAIPHEDVVKAKLVLTDDLINATLKKRKH